jgi:hypothetical protein
MPQNTPNRGYTYPLYDEPTMDFPAAIEELATDINDDVELLEEFIGDAYDRASVRIFGSSAAQSIPEAVQTTISWSGGGVSYDNAGMANLTPTGGLTLTQPGVYLISGYVFISAPGSGSNFGLRLALNSDAGVIPVPGNVTLRGHPTQDTWMSVMGLHQVLTGATDNITLSLWHNRPGTLSIPAPSRQMTATKITSQEPY